MSQFTRIVRTPPTLLALGVMLGCLVLLVTTSRAANIPDPGFGSNGVVKLPFAAPSGPIQFNELDTRPILVAGTTTDYGPTGATLQTTIFRLLPDGAPDQSYGSKGVVSHSVTMTGELPSRHAVLTDGTVLLTSLGQASPFPVPSPLFVRRILANGILDQRFAGGGKLLIPGFVPVSQEHFQAVSRSNGRTLLSTAGYEFANPSQGGFFERRVIRNAMLLASGELDSTFGNQGIVDGVFFPGRRSQIVGTIHNEDDSFYAYGSVEYSPSDSDVALARFRPDGSPDTQFGTNGIVEIDFERGRDSISQLAKLPYGRLIAVVDSFALSTVRPSYQLLMRFREDGKIDRTFGDGGRVTVTLTPSSPYFPATKFLHLTGDSKILILEAASQQVCSGTGVGFVLSGRTSEGEVDSEFGSGGRVSVPLPAVAYGYSSALIDRDGRLLMLGFAYTPFPPRGAYAPTVLLSRSQRGTVPPPPEVPFHLYVPTNASCPPQRMSGYPAPPTPSAREVGGIR